jgi:hypothetical protein
MKKDILKGIALASVAAYVFAALLMLNHNPNREGALYDSFAAALFIFLFPVTLALVVAMGALLGAITPRLFAGRSFFVALSGGALLGLAAGFVGAWLCFGSRSEFDALLLIGLYCAPWAAAYACYRRRDPELLP